MPTRPSALKQKGIDTKETVMMKYNNYEQKRTQKITECQLEYKQCKEYTKYFTIQQYQSKPVKKHWIPSNNEGGSPSKSQILNNTISGGGGGGGGGGGNTTNNNIGLQTERSTTNGTGSLTGGGGEGGGEGGGGEGGGEGGGGADGGG